MKKLAFFLVLTAFSSSAFAITSRLAFSVRSSGSDAFPCNAGIMHGTPTDTDSYSRDGNCAWCANVGMETETGTFSSNFGDNDANAYGITHNDVMKYRFMHYNPAIRDFEGNEIAGSVQAMTSGRLTAMKDQYNNSRDGQDLKNSSNITITELENNHRPVEAGVRKNNVLFSLVYLFSSEQYGAKYFVDICNYTPELFGAENSCTGSDCFLNGEDTYLWAYKSFLSGQQGNDTTLDYVALSGLTIYSQLACDGELVGAQANAGTLTSGLSVLNTLELAAGGIPPKKCVTRFYFEETNSTHQRLNQTQEACFEVATEINEPTEDSSMF